MNTSHQFVFACILTGALGCTSDKQADSQQDVSGDDQDAGAPPQDAGARPQDADAGPDAAARGQSADDNSSETDSSSPTDPDGGAELTAEASFQGNPNEAAPSVGRLEVQLNRPVTLEIEVQGGGESWNLESTDASTTHDLWIVGLKPSTTYDLTVTASDEEGGSLTLSPEQNPSLSWSTPDLPDDFPPFEFIDSDPAQMEPGMTLFNVREESKRFYLAIVDSEGAVRWWYHNDKHRILYGHHLTPWGTLVFVHDNEQVVEIDWAGNERDVWYAAAHPKASPPASGIPVDAIAFHHDVTTTSRNNILALAAESRVIEDFPSSTTDPLAPATDAVVVGDVIAEFTREGEVVTSISLLDLLDTTRVGHDATNDWWNSVFPDSNDWSHANAVVYDPASDAYVVSCRNQDAIVKIDRATESVVWILGNHANWSEDFEHLLLTPVGDLEWPFHQHAVEVTPSGIGVFDNGMRDVPAFEEYQSPYYSRAVEFIVDEEEMTVTENWTYGPHADDPGSFYAPIMSDADWQPETGNVLITAGTLTADSDPEYRYARIREVTAAGDAVFEMLVVDAPSSEPTNFSTFGADRIPDVRRLW